MQNKPLQYFLQAPTVQEMISYIVEVQQREVVSLSLLSHSSQKYCSSAESSINDLPGCGFPTREPCFIICSE